MKPGKKYIYLISGIVLFLALFIILVLHFYYRPSPIKFDKPQKYSMSQDELAEYNKLEKLMTNDSTRYCEADFDGNGTLDRAYIDGWKTITLFILELLM